MVPRSFKCCGLDERAELMVLCSLQLCRSWLFLLGFFNVAVRWWDTPWWKAQGHCCSPLYQHRPILRTCAGLLELTTAVMVNEKTIPNATLLKMMQ